MPMADKLTTFTDENWQREVLSSAQPVLVDFWADWCAPCKVLHPIVEAVADHFGGRIRVGKMNVEENAHVPFQYKITTLPTLLLLKGGQVSEQRVGLISREKLVELLDPHIGAPR